MNQPAVSYALPEHKQNYLIDIDGTITDDVPNEEPERMAICLPYNGSAKRINELYDQGHIVTFFTSRKDEHREVTETWLKKYGYKYHQLLLNKPQGGKYNWIDNHQVNGIKYSGEDWNGLRF